MFRALGLGGFRFVGFGVVVPPYLLVIREVELNWKFIWLLISQASHHPASSRVVV